MLKATAGKVLPTTIIGSLPRPSWYTENLGTKAFVDAMANNKFREQYTDALACYLRDQEVAGLDIVTDGDCRFDQDVGGQTWTSYPPRHMSGFEAEHPKLARAGAGGSSQRCVQPGTPRSGRCRLPGDSDRRSAIALACRTACSEQGHHSRLHAQGVQQHGEGVT